MPSNTMIVVDYHVQVQRYRNTFWLHSDTHTFRRGKRSSSNIVCVFFLLQVLQYLLLFVLLFFIWFYRFKYSWCLIFTVCVNENVLVYNVRHIKFGVSFALSLSLIFLICLSTFFTYSFSLASLARSKVFAVCACVCLVCHLLQTSRCQILTIPNKNKTDCCENKN